MADAPNDLEKRIVDAQGAVAMWEGIPEASRDLFPDFQERLARARSALDALVQERRAAKPWVWRLEGAERTAARAEKARAKASEDVENIVHEEALAAFTAIRAEVAEHKSDGPNGGMAAAGFTVDMVLGLIKQLSEMPNAAVSGNFEAALQAALGQAQSSLPAAVDGSAAQAAMRNSEPQSQVRQWQWFARPTQVPQIPNPESLFQTSCGKMSRFGTEAGTS